MHREPQQLSLFGDLDPASVPVTPKAEVEAPPERRIRRVRDVFLLEHRLRALLSVPLAGLVLTDNRRRIVSARPTIDGLAVRIHRCFLDASDDVLSAVAIFFTTRRKREREAALATIRHHFDTVGGPDRAMRSRPIPLEPKGEVYHLEEIRDEINQSLFGGEVDVLITWGRRPQARKKRARMLSVRLGTYTQESNLVRIHRSLDRRSVPRFVVESVVHHEMLHAVVPPVVEPGFQRQIHPPEFRRRERLFPRFHEAERWITENLGRLARPD